MCLRSIGTRTTRPRAFSQRFYKIHGKMPTMFQASVYGAVMHYLKAIDATGTDEAKAVMAKMRATPINDFMTTNGRIREDGRVIRDLYLMQVKTPAGVARRLGSGEGDRHHSRRQGVPPAVRKPVPAGPSLTEDSAGGQFIHRPPVMLMAWPVM